MRAITATSGSSAVCEARRIAASAGVVPMTPESQGSSTVGGYACEAHAFASRSSTTTRRLPVYSSFGANLRHKRTRTSGHLTRGISSVAIRHALANSGARRDPRGRGLRFQPSTTGPAHASRAIHVPREATKPPVCTDGLVAAPPRPDGKGSDGADVLQQATARPPGLRMAAPFEKERGHHRARVAGRECRSSQSAANEHCAIGDMVAWSGNPRRCGPYSANTIM